MSQLYNLKLTQAELEFLHNASRNAKSFNTMIAQYGTEAKVADASRNLKLSASLNAKLTKLLNLSNDDGN